MRNSNMKFANARKIKHAGIGPDSFVELRVEVDGIERNVPMNTNNRHYKELLRQIAAGETEEIKESD